MTMGWEMIVVAVVGVAAAAWAVRAVYRSVTGKNKKNAMGCSGDCACPGAKQATTERGDETG